MDARGAPGADDRRDLRPPLELRQGKREKSSRVNVADLTGLPDYSTASPLSQVLRNEENLEVRQQLIRLPKKFKVPLVLRYYKHMSYSEIARALKTRLPAVRMMIFRAKEQLRRNLRRDQSGKKTSQLSARRGPRFLEGPSRHDGPVRYQ